MGFLCAQNEGVTCETEGVGDKVRAGEAFLVMPIAGKDVACVGIAGVNDVVGGECLAPTARGCFVLCCLCGIMLHSASHDLGCTAHGALDHEVMRHCVAEGYRFRVNGCSASQFGPM